MDLSEKELSVIQDLWRGVVGQKVSDACWA